MLDIQNKMKENQDICKAGALHSCLQEFQDKFLTSQLELVSSDPGRFLAWLVLVSSMISLLLGPLACLAVLPTIYLAWLCRDSTKYDQEEEEEEWLLDRFIGFLRQLDNEEVSDSLECETVEEIETASRVVSLQSTDSSKGDGDDNDDDDDDPSDDEEFVFITPEDL